MTTASTMTRFIHECFRGFAFWGLVEVSWSQAGVLLGSFWDSPEPSWGPPRAVLGASEAQNARTAKNFQ